MSNQFEHFKINLFFHPDTQCTSVLRLSMILGCFVTCATLTRMVTLMRLRTTSKVDQFNRTVMTAALLFAAYKIDADSAQIKALRFHRGAFGVSKGTPEPDVHGRHMRETVSECQESRQTNIHTYDGATLEEGGIYVKVGIAVAIQNVAGIPIKGTVGKAKQKYTTQAITQHIQVTPRVSNIATQCMTSCSASRHGVTEPRDSVRPPPSHSVGQHEQTKSTSIVAASHGGEPQNCPRPSQIGHHGKEAHKHPETNHRCVNSVWLYMTSKSIDRCEKQCNSM